MSTAGTTGSMYSPLWHRVEALRPRLQPQATVERQIIRGEVWYVAKDRLSNRAHRFSPAVYAMLMRMDGRNTLDEVWRQAVELFDEDAPSQDQIIQLLSQLYSLDLIQIDRTVDLGELTDRGERARRQQALQRYQNPLFFRLPLLDPQRFLNATMHLVRPIFSPIGAVVWLAIVAWFGAEVAMNFEPLTTGLADRVLATDNLMLMLLIFPVLKILHELGHAYATKVAGGEVHEIGIMFLIFMPAPYVDASDSVAFPRKRDRILVAAAGIMVELVIAAAALAVWLAAEPGFVRAIAFNVIVIASASTLIFNGNPLLRFDGYYILCDLIEIPNLASRATRYWAYLVQKYLFGTMAPDPVSAPGEAWWFFLFAPASLAYRLTVLFGIAVFVGSQFFIVGLALAAWTVFLSLIWPLIKMARFILLSPSLESRRTRALAVSSALAGLIAIGLFAVPVPYGTVARGMVWIPDDARVYAESPGDVVEVLARSGSTVAKGDPLFKLTDPFIQSKRVLVQSRLAELEYRLTAAEAATPYDVEVFRKQIELARSELAEVDRKIAVLTVRAPIAGRVVVPRPQDLVATYVKKGQLLAYVFPETRPAVHAFVPETDVDTVRGFVRRIDVWLDDSSQIVSATLDRDVPHVGRKLPNKALAQSNGGPFPLDPSAKEDDVSMISFVELALNLAPDAAEKLWGQRAWVRFDHGSPPIAERLYRSARQLFLRRFNA